MKREGSELRIEWEAAARAKPGENVCGDRCAVRLDPGTALLAVADGAGHGEEAALAAETAVSILKANAATPLEELLPLCHQGLRGTRGAALSAAVLDLRRRTMRWTGIGNVEGVLLRFDADGAAKREHLLMKGGVIGYEFPPPRISTLEVAAGDVLVFATDGIRAGFWERVRPTDSPGAIAHAVLDAYGKGIDDALALVAKVSGGAA